MDTMPSKAPDRETSGVVCTAWIPAPRYPSRSSLPDMKSQFRTSGTTTLRPVRKASPQVVRVVGRTHSQRLAASALNPRWPRSRSSPLVPRSGWNIWMLAKSECRIAIAASRICSYSASDSVGVYQLRGDVLKALGGVKLRREHLLTLSQRRVGGFQLASLLLNELFQF